MTTAKARAAEDLFPLLSVFHDVSGLPLVTVREGLSDGILDRIVLDFGSKTLVIKAEQDDDTVTFEIACAPYAECYLWTDVSHIEPWGKHIGSVFGCGWVTINQQGYLDGLLLSFAGITPNLLITVIASSLKTIVLKADPERLRPPQG